MESVNRISGGRDWDPGSDLTNPSCVLVELAKTLVKVMVVDLWFVPARPNPTLGSKLGL